MNGSWPRLPALALLVILSFGGALPARATPSAAPMAREVYAFFLPGSRAYMLETADYSVLTTVAFFALEALPNGTLRRTTASGVQTRERTAWHSDWMGEVIAKAHAHGAKVVLTITRFGWDAEGHARSIELLSDPAALARLADETADEVIARGADGVNVDFEPMYEEVREGFVDFLRLLRAELDERRPGLSLVFDSTGSATNYPIAEALAEGGADSVFVMAYPFHTRLSERAGAVSPMGGLPFDVTESVERVLRRTTHDRIILGLPNFATRWPTETRYRHSLVRKDAGLYGSPANTPISTAMETAAAYGRRWDTEQLVPWTRWRARSCADCRRTWWQLYYDDTQSMTLKYDFVNDLDLAGVGIWRLNYGADRQDLYSLMRAKFGS